MARFRVSCEQLPELAATAACVSVRLEVSGLLYRFGGLTCWVNGIAIHGVGKTREKAKALDFCT